MPEKPAPGAARQPRDQQAPDQPTDLGRGGWLATAKRAFAEFRDDDMMSWAAALTYYAVLSIFPAMLVLVALLGLVGQYPETSNAILDIVASVGPQSAVETLRGTIEGVVQSGGGAGALLGVGLLSAIWAASGYVGGFFKASNAIYEVEEGRPFWKLRPIQIALTVFLLVIIAFGAVVFVATGAIARSIGDVIGLGDTAVTIWSIAKWPVLAVAVMILFAVLYWAAPNVKQPKFSWLTPGGAIGLITAVIASAGFGFYVSNFGNYNATYGALAFVPLFLVWLWIANLALLFGAEFDAELERQRRIEGGMRPVDQEPFLPHRQEPDDSKDGADMAREQLRERETDDDKDDPPAPGEAPSTAPRREHGRFQREGDRTPVAHADGPGEGANGRRRDEGAGDGNAGTRTVTRRQGGLVGRLLRR